MSRTQVNLVRDKLVSGGTPLGVIVSYIRMPSIMEVVASAGYDFVVIDMQHSAFSLETVSEMCRVARSAGVMPIVRPPSHNLAEVQRILDQGAMGLMYPNVGSREEVDEVRNLLREDHLLVIQIESRAAVQSVEPIIEGGGIDVVEIGRHDLSASYGVPGETRHPRVLEAVDTVIKACRDRNVAVGGYGRSRDDAEDLLRRGVRWMICQSDLTLLNWGFKTSIDVVRAAVRELGA